MKKAVVLMAVAVLLGSGLICQNHNQHLLSQSVNDWKGEVADANLVGKSPEQVTAFLDQHGVTHDKYWSGEMTLDDKDMGQRVGYITGHVGPVAHTLGKDGWQTWYIGIGFNFDGQNKCTQSIISWHPNWF